MGMKEVTQEAVQLFVNVLDAQDKKAWAGHPFPSEYTIEESPKYFKVYRSSNRKFSKSIVAFIAKQDGKTKQLGEYSAGDIFKPAGYNTPAKGTRGNIFEGNGESATDKRGSIRYLR